MQPETPVDAEPPVPQPELPGRPWGFWATGGWAALIGILYLLVQLVAMGIFVFATGINIRNIESNGMFLAISTIIGAPVIVGSCLAVAWIRKRISVADYLALHWPEKRVVTRWVIIALAFAAASDALTAAQGKPIVPDFMVEIYQSAGAFPLLLWITLLVAAPLGEEFFFRGFLFAGIRESSLGVAGAIIITAILWAIIHLQYDLYGIGTIFVLGIVLGVARQKTSSLWVCMLMHFLANLIATLEVVAYLQMVNP